ncbi:DUF6243 family protein [Streptomyces sp. SAJ15]|uniref:DUF6243 family protein n=1 Tax=Streptomyces sp. SAJ15 TaxID=2011095 RepID=UPI00118492B5|nr:DUF6243 family protein [Streptomyces sp. SAJ15]TVL90044.1 hypothetical protein CD790_24545 [Streptomyces sp. SAJ15]
MSKGKGSAMLGVGGPRANVPRSAMRGGRRDSVGGRGGMDPLAQKRELLRKLQQGRDGGSLRES